MMVARAKNKVLTNACRLGFGDRKTLNKPLNIKCIWLVTAASIAGLKFKLHIGVTKHKRRYCQWQPTSHCNLHMGESIGSIIHGTRRHEHHFVPNNLKTRLCLWQIGSFAQHENTWQPQGLLIKHFLRTKPQHTKVIATDRNEQLLGLEATQRLGQTMAKLAKEIR